MAELTKNKEQRRLLIEHMLSAVEAELLDRGRNVKFINSLREWFDERGDLTDKQIEALRRWYHNAA